MRAMLFCHIALFTVYSCAYCQSNQSLSELKESYSIQRSTYNALLKKQQSIYSSVNERSDIYTADNAQETVYAVKQNKKVNNTSNSFSSDLIIKHSRNRGVKDWAGGSNQYYSYYLERTSNPDIADDASWKLSSFERHPSGLEATFSDSFRNLVPIFDFNNLSHYLHSNPRLIDSTLFTISDIHADAKTDEIAISRDGQAITLSYTSMRRIYNAYTDKRKEFESVPVITHITYNDDMLLFPRKIVQKCTTFNNQNHIYTVDREHRFSKDGVMTFCDEKRTWLVTVNDVSIYKSYSNISTQLDINTLQPDAIGISQYGLPEPEGVVWAKPIPSYVWYLSIAGGAAAIMFLCGWLLKRRAKARGAAATTTSAPPKLPAKQG